MTRPSRTRPVAALGGFWADDKGLSAFSVLLVAIVFVIPPLVPAGTGRSFVADVVYALLLVSGVHALGDRTLVRRLMMAVAVVTLAVDFGSWFVPVAAAPALGMSIVSLLLFLGIVLGRTLRDGPVTTRRLHGGVAAYLLLGVIWAYAYALLALLRPGAFSGPMSAADGPRAFFYFSFATLTTTGFGDVLPVHPSPGRWRCSRPSAALLHRDPDLAARLAGRVAGQDGPLGRRPGEYDERS